jgi:hypothetical protein
MRCDERTFGCARTWRNMSGRIAHIIAAESIADASNEKSDRSSFGDGIMDIVTFTCQKTPYLKSACYIAQLTTLRKSCVCPCHQERRNQLSAREGLLCSTPV